MCFYVYNIALFLLMQVCITAYYWIRWATQNGEIIDKMTLGYHGFNLKLRIATI